jgi:hypothetical protein
MLCPYEDSGLSIRGDTEPSMIGGRSKRRPCESGEKK